MKYFISTAVFALLFIGVFMGTTFAQDYQLLQPLPFGGAETTNVTPTSYIEGVFMLIIGIAGVLAVIMIIVGGIKYMTTDAMGAKNDAKKTIQNAIFGLLLALGAWIILYSISPNLTSFNISLSQVPTEDIGAPALPPTCSGCVAISVPHRPPPQGCAAPAGSPCMVNSELNDRLIGLRGSNVSFTVTESYPPTVQHQAACHNSGTCVDAVIPNSSPASIRAFILAADINGLRAVFEIPPGPNADARRAAIIAAGIPASQVIIVNHATGEHFSIYMR